MEHDKEHYRNGDGRRNGSHVYRSACVTPVDFGTSSFSGEQPGEKNSVGSARFRMSHILAGQLSDMELCRRIEGNFGISVIIGGTSTRALVMNADDEIVCGVQIKWEHLLEWTKAQNAPLPSPEEFFQLLLNELNSVMSGKSAPGTEVPSLPHVHKPRMEVMPLTDGFISIEQIRTINISAAGTVNPDGNLLTSVNTPIKMVCYPIGEEVRRALEIAGLNSYSDGHFDNPLRDINVALDNDGGAASLGEALHPDGLLLEVEKGIFMIIGTGIGGGAVEFVMEDGVRTVRLNRQITELGHLLVRTNNLEKLEDESRNGHTHAVSKRGYYYTCYTLADLERLGLYAPKTREYIGDIKSLKKTFLEHRLAGPWLAIRFLKECIPLITDEGKTLEDFGEYIGVSSDALTQLHEKQVGERHLWAISVRDGQIRPINDFIFGTRPGGWHDARSDVISDLYRKAYDYKLKVYEEMGYALAALLLKYPGNRIVLGSSIAEKCFGPDPEFQEIVRHVLDQCGAQGEVMISKIKSGEARESAWVSDTLRRQSGTAACPPG